MKEKFGDTVLGNGMKSRKLRSIRTDIFGGINVADSHDTLRILCAARLSYAKV